MNAVDVSNSSSFSVSIFVFIFRTFFLLVLVYTFFIDFFFLSSFRSFSCLSFFPCFSFLQNFILLLFFVLLPSLFCLFLYYPWLDLTPLSLLNIFISKTKCNITLTFKACFTTFKWLLPVIVIMWLCGFFLQTFLGWGLTDCTQKLITGTANSLTALD
jgi:hypothetical protein